MGRSESVVETTVDRFGRIVIPQRTRAHFGLVPGSVVKIDESASGIVLRPARQEAPLRLEGGVLVFTGKASGDIEQALERHRAERVRTAAGKIIR